MKFEKTEQYLFLIFLCFLISILTILPLGSFSLLKSLFFIVTLFFYIISKYNFSKTLIISLLPFILTIILSLFVAIFNNFFEKEILTELKALILFGIILVIFIDITKIFSLKKIEILLKTFIISHFIYIIIKLVFFYLIYTGSLNFNFLKKISNDFVLAFFGNIPRISISNDLFTFVAFSLLYLNKNLFNKYFRFILYFFMILNTLISFNRITILSIFCFILFYNILFFRKRELFKIIIIIIIFIGIFFFSYNKSILIQGIINTLKNRFSNEGSLSNQEKIYQYFLIFKSINWEIFLFGKGIGEFLHDYIRRNIEGFRYGYEAFLGIFFFQFGILGVLIFYILINIKFLRKKTFFSKRLLLHFIIANIWILHGLVDPVLLTSNSAIVLGVIYLSYDYNYKIFYGRF